MFSFALSEFTMEHNRTQQTSNLTFAFPNRSAGISDFDLWSAPFGYATVLLVIVGSSGSLYCIYSICKSNTRPISAGSPSTFSAMNVLIMSLCVATFLFSALILPVSIHTQLYPVHNIMGTAGLLPFCRFQAFAYFTLIGVCAFSHSAIAVNRLLAVVFSSQYPSVKSSKVTYLLLALSWLLPAGLFLPALFHKWADFGLSAVNRCVFTTLHPVYQMVYKVGYSFVPFSITLSAYAVIVLHTYLSRRRLNQHARHMTMQSANRFRSAVQIAEVRGRRANATRVDLRATRTAFILCMIFLICFVPNSVYGVAAKNLKGLQSMVGVGFTYWVWIGCTINPLVFLFLDSKLRRRICSRKGQLTVNSLGTVTPAVELRPSSKETADAKR